MEGKWKKTKNKKQKIMRSSLNIEYKGRANGGCC